ncbi:ADP-ribosyltransferase [Nocardia thraciensis]
MQPRSRLLSAEEDALKGYAAFNFAGHNRALREGGPLGDWRGQQIEHIRAALEKLPDHKGVVYRGTYLSDDMLALYQKGNVVRDRAFLSTAANPHARFPGNAQFRIVSRTGKDISKYTIKKEEQEVLFKEETPFEVVNRKDTVQGGYEFSYIDLVERGDLA